MTECFLCLSSVCLSFPLLPRSVPQPCFLLGYSLLSPLLLCLCWGAGRSNASVALFSFCPYAFFAFLGIDLFVQTFPVLLMRVTLLRLFFLQDLKPGDVTGKRNLWENKSSSATKVTSYITAASVIMFYYNSWFFTSPEGGTFKLFHPAKNSQCVFIRLVIWTVSS